MSDLRRALEGALVEQPEDRATWMPYADHLAEDANPATRARCEFIQVQWDLEDAARPTAERDRKCGRITTRTTRQQG